MSSPKIGRATTEASLAEVTDMGYALVGSDANEELTDDHDAEQVSDLLPVDLNGVQGVIVGIAAMPAGSLITEAGLAGIFDKCIASIKAAVERNELPRPVRIMGKNCWTSTSIIRHIEDRLDKEARKFARLRD